MSDVHDSSTRAAEATASTVRAFYDAFLNRRREAAEALITDDFIFTSPYDDGIDRAAYFTRCWPNGDRFTHFLIERLAADSEGAFVTYRCTINDGTSFGNTEYLTLKGGRVASVHVYFGATYRDGKFVTDQASNADPSGPSDEVT